MLPVDVHDQQILDPATQVQSSSPSGVTEAPVEGVPIGCRLIATPKQSRAGERRVWHEPG
jgi:hypothetical protein